MDIFKLTPNCGVWDEQYFGAQSHRFGVNQGKGRAQEFNTRDALLVDRVKTPWSLPNTPMTV